MLNPSYIFEDQTILFLIYTEALLIYTEASFT